MSGNLCVKLNKQRVTAILIGFTREEKKYNAQQ